MKRSAFFAVVAVLVALAFLPGATVSAASLTTLDFEGLPDLYYSSGGNTNIGTYYPGVTFGPDATILDRVIYGYNSSGYPPHSGDAVFYSSTNAFVDIVFDVPASYVEGWFTFGDSTGYLEAYDSSDTLIASASMPSNYGSSDKMSVSAAGIKRVRIHDEGNTWTGDDIAYGTMASVSSVPGISLWGIAALAVLFSGTLIWSVRRRLITEGRTR